MTLDIRPAPVLAPSRPVTPQRDAATQPRRIERFRSARWFSAITVVLDVLSAAGAVVLAQWWLPGAMEVRDFSEDSWAFVLFVVAALATRSMYTRKLNIKFLDDFEPVETAVAMAALATLTVLLQADPSFQSVELAAAQDRPGDLVLRVWVCAAILMPTVRLGKSLVYRYLRRKFRIAAPTLIVGSGPIAHQLIARMHQVAEYGLRPVGVLDDTRPPDDGLLDVPYLGTLYNLESAARATHAEELIVAPSLVPDEQLAHAAMVAHTLGIRVRVVPRLMDVVGVGARVEHLGGIPLIVLCHVDPKGWQFAFKHVSDKLVAGVGLLAISPVFIGLALLVKISSPGPVFYRQERIGRDGKIFDCLKFRSMRPQDPADAGFAMEDGSAPGGVEGVDRRTRIGKVMRQTSMDELPQLLNVLRGDMSLVGPRPERPAFVELFELQVRRYGDRHRVKAGITGWAQVHGLRGQTSIADRAEFDNYYIENWSLRLDFRILLLTVLAVLHKAED
ncbi:sugar transferase [Mycobacterium deserti]|uniref:Sugar transferase n=1 Tax=Mycobacterium deserti TaxID=2978347 RepID=A0ABT2M6A1_9MYCO|nr:sugar transferase [Mycobacterium deserti]MCT7657786.1 sugar transferase [Mycobacterium deserti]